MSLATTQPAPELAAQATYFDLAEKTLPGGGLGAYSLPEDVRIEDVWMFVGDSYEISPDESIVKSLCRSYEAVFGKELPIAGHSSVTDACRLVGRGKVPTVLWGFGTETGHSNNEYVKISQLGSSCKVAMLTVLDYLEGNCD